MYSAETEDVRSLSAEAFSELKTPPDRTEVEDELPVDFADPGPSVVTSTELGERIIAVGMELLKKPVREDAGTNEDKDGLIRSFFLQGVPWSAGEWDNWLKNNPDSEVPRPEWCAAFACYCARQGYVQTGIAEKLPRLLSASTSRLRSLFISLGRFIHRDDLFDPDGQIKPGATLPGPGDIVLWQGHTGVLFDMRADGSYQTLEGNTRPSRDAVPGVYLLPNSSSRKIKKNGEWIFSLTGFCQLASIDG